MEWKQEEDNYILSQYAQIGNRWSLIARKLSGRTDNQVRNRFKSIQKQLRLQSLKINTKPNKKLKTEPKTQENEKYSPQFECQSTTPYIHEENEDMSPFQLDFDNNSSINNLQKGFQFQQFELQEESKLIEQDHCCFQKQINNEYYSYGHVQQPVNKCHQYTSLCCRKKTKELDFLYLNGNSIDTTVQSNEVNQDFNNQILNRNEQYQNPQIIQQRPKYQCLQYTCPCCRTQTKELDFVHPNNDVAVQQNKQSDWYDDVAVQQNMQSDWNDDQIFESMYTPLCQVTYKDYSQRTPSWGSLMEEENITKDERNFIQQDFHFGQF